MHGTVHDEGAAMLGGISGHAGLFSDANDLMKLMELYRRMGEYGGQQLIGRNVMEDYTRVQFPENNNRRGLGFDKPLLNNSELYHKKILILQEVPHLQVLAIQGIQEHLYGSIRVSEITYVFLMQQGLSDKK